MTSPRLEGTFQLDGLLEGPLFTPEDEPHLREVVRQAERDQLVFSLSLQPGRFSLLADAKTRKRPPDAAALDRLVVKHLNRLLEFYSPEECAQMMSTIRSVEVGPGCQIQTLYPIGADGRVQLQQRTVACDTVAPKPRLTARQMKVYALGCIGTLVLLLGLSAWVVPYGEWAGRLWTSLKPYDMNSLEVDAAAYEAFFRVVKVDHDRGRKAFVVIGQVREGFPLTEQRLNEIWRASGDSIFERLAVECIARQRVTCRSYDAAGRLVDHVDVPMRWDAGEPGVFSLTVPFHAKTRRIELAAF